MNAPPAPEKNEYVIVVGSSAGGIEPILAFVSALPDNVPAAIVIAQHLSPAHESHLASIIEGRTDWRVQIVEAREEIRTGTIYVVPPDHDVELVDGVSAPAAEPRRRPKPSIDRLFISAAQVYGDRAIGIILSGMGSYGLAGARAIKEYGGTVIVQDPLTALHPSMPMAIPPTLVDMVAAPGDIAQCVVRIIDQAALPMEPSDQNLLRTMLGQLCDRSGIDFEQYKSPTIMRRLARLMVASGASTLDEYMRYLQTNPEGYQRLLAAFLIKVTEFFRDTPLFDELRTAVLPRLILEARERGGELRLWSAGTSTGEEAYSLAILCAEVIQELGSEVNVRIFATDVDEAAINFARRGIYTAEALQHIPPSWIERYFVRNGDAFEVGKRIRNMTVFGQHDLGQRAPFPNIDLCSCRNVLIYFNRDLQTRALQLFAFSLRDGGVLVLGKAETTNALSDYFKPLNSGLKIYQRKGERILIPPSRLKDAPMSLDVRASLRQASQLLQSTQQRSPEARSSSNDALGAMLFASTIGVVVIDRRYDILLLNASARTMLGIHGVAIGDDLLHTIRSPDGERLRELIDAALRGEAPAPIEIRIGVTEHHSHERWANVTTSADHGVASHSETLVLLFSDVSASVAQRRESQRELAESKQHTDELRTQVDQLTAREKSLFRANEELTAANVELRSTNEQLLITAEEAASANEEIETLNEEMQATNEELETLNEELQATVEELNTTNDELEARSAELEQAAELRETVLRTAVIERDALLQRVREHTVAVGFLAPDGSIIRADPLIDEWLTNDPFGWRSNGNVTVGGIRYRARHVPIATEAQPYYLVTLEYEEDPRANP